MTDQVPLRSHVDVEVRLLQMEGEAAEFVRKAQERDGRRLPFPRVPLQIPEPRLQMAKREDKARSGPRNTKQISKVTKSNGIIFQNHLNHKRINNIAFIMKRIVFCTINIFSKFLIFSLTVCTLFLKWGGCHLKKEFKSYEKTKSHWAINGIKCICINRL